MLSKEGPAHFQTTVLGYPLLVLGKAKSVVFRIYRRRLTCGSRHVFESFRKILILTVLMSGSLGVYGSVFFMDALLTYVCTVRCGRPTVFVWLCKLHTIEGHVLCHATVVSRLNIIKAEKSRRLHVALLDFSLPTPVAFPARVDPNRGSEETVRSPGVL